MARWLEQLKASLSKPSTKSAQLKQQLCTESISFLNALANLPVQPVEAQLSVYWPKLTKMTAWLRGQLKMRKDQEAFLKQARNKILAEEAEKKRRGAPAQALKALHAAHDQFVAGELATEDDVAEQRLWEAMEKVLTAVADAVGVERGAGAVTAGARGGSAESAATATAPAPAPQGRVKRELVPPPEGGSLAVAGTAKRSKLGAASAARFHPQLQPAIDRARALGWGVSSDGGWAGRGELVALAALGPYGGLPLHRGECSATLRPAAACLPPFMLRVVTRDCSWDGAQAGARPAQPDAKGEPPMTVGQQQQPQQQGSDAKDGGGNDELQWGFVLPAVGVAVQVEQALRAQLAAAPLPAADSVGAGSQAGAGGSTGQTRFRAHAKPMRDTDARRVVDALAFAMRQHIT